MGDEQGLELGEEVETVAGAGVASGIISWHRCRVGSMESPVGIMVGLDIAKALATEEE